MCKSIPSRRTLTCTSNISSCSSPPIATSLSSKLLSRAMRNASIRAATSCAWHGLEPRLSSEAVHPTTDSGHQPRRGAHRCFCLRRQVPSKRRPGHEQNAVCCAIHPARQLSHQRACQLRASRSGRPDEALERPRWSPSQASAARDSHRITASAFGEERRQAHLLKHVQIVVARRAVSANANVQPLFEHLPNRRDAAGKFEVAAGIVRDACASLAQIADFTGVHMDAMRARTLARKIPCFLTQATGGAPLALRLSSTSSAVSER